MKYAEYEVAFSPASLNKYLVACGWNKAKALKLYRNNIMLCKAIYGILNVFEVVLRNAINEHYKTYFDDKNWIRNQLQPGGMLESHPQCAATIKTIADLENKGMYTNDRVVSSVTFGFWTYLFTKRPYQSGGKSLLRIFPDKEKGLGQRAIYNELQAVKSFRNRIAHYEAICFDSMGSKSTSTVRENYAIIVKYIQFLGFSESSLFYGLDVIPHKLLNKIDLL